MPLLFNEDYFLVDPNDSLNTGRIKWNTNTESIVSLVNSLENQLQSLSPEDIVGLLDDGLINSDFLPFEQQLAAQNVDFVSPNFISSNVQSALEELYNSVIAVDTSGEAINITIDDTSSNFTSENVEGALEELYDMVASILSSGGDGDVLGPVSSVNNNLVVFDGVTGKIIKDSGVSTSSFAAVSHNHSATNITSGTLSVERGGTGLSVYSTGSYLRAASPSTLEQRTVAQVRSDIGAMASSGGTFTGLVTFSSGFVSNSSVTFSNNAPLYIRDSNSTPIPVVFINPSNNMILGDVSVPLTLESSTSISAVIGAVTRTLLHSGSSLDDLSDVASTGATVDQVLSWNGATWVPRTVTEGGGGGGDFLPLTGGTISGNLSITGRAFASTGSASAPSLSVTGDTDTGIYFPASNQLGVTVDGSQRLNVSSQGIKVSPSGSSAGPAFSFINDPDTGFYSSEANVISVATGGVARMHMSSAGIRFQGSGSASTPVISTQVDQDTGIFFPTANSLGIATGGTQRFLVNDSGVFAGSSQVLTEASTLSSLANVSTTTPSTNDVLTWNGTTWTPLPQTGGGGGLTNPLLADLNANNFKINNPKIVGNQDVPVNAASLITGGSLVLTPAFNAYYLSSLSSNLNIQLPSVTVGNAPYGYVTVKLTANADVTLSYTNGIVWEKVNLEDDNPTIPNTNGSVFTIYYRYDTVMEAYVVNITSLVPATGSVEIVPSSIQTSNLPYSNVDTHTFTHNYVSTVQDGSKALIVVFLTDIVGSKTITAPAFLTPLFTPLGVSDVRPRWWMGYYVPTQGDLNAGSLTMTFTVPTEISQFLTFEVSGLDTDNPVVDDVADYITSGLRNSVPSNLVNVVRGGLVFAGMGNIPQFGVSALENFTMGSNPSNFTSLHHRPLAANSGGSVGWLVSYVNALADGTVQTPVFERRDDSLYIQMQAISLRPK